MSSQSQRSLTWLLQQFQLKPGKLDIAASLQTLVLVSVPIGVGVLMGHPAASAIALADALQQRQPPRPLPDFEPYLEAIRDRVEQLHAERASEFASNPGTATPTLQAIQEGTPISTELDRIAQEITSLHSAIVRLQHSNRMVLS
jgi:hypothetical protein